MKQKLSLPRMRDITLKQLRVLEAVERYGKITAAANALGVTPPAVTLQLKLLEQSAGLTLLERSQRGLRLTDAGRHVLDAHLRIETALSECGSLISRMAGADQGRVSVGVLGTAKYFAPRAIAAFASHHPHIDVKLTEGNREGIVAALERFDLDIAIMGSPPDTLPAVHETIGDHPFVIVAPPGHALCGRHGLGLAHLANERLLLREPGSGTRTLMERTFAQHKVTPRFGIEFGGNETIKQGVMAGHGLAFISAHTIASEVSAGLLHVLPIQGLPIMRQWYAVRAEAKQLLPAGASVWRFLISEGPSFLPQIHAAG